ncbi:hypothetical protein [Arthrobacter sp.]|uniref:hypothetical protein n=1 Tax=Arthrobacter sp. TaxID=1667 RepID=UPI003A8E9D68
MSMSSWAFLILGFDGVPVNVDPSHPLVPTSYTIRGVMGITLAGFTRPTIPPARPREGRT